MADKQSWFKKLFSGYQKAESAASQLKKEDRQTSESPVSLVWRIVKYWKVVVIILAVAMIAFFIMLIITLLSALSEASLTSGEDQISTVGDPFYQAETVQAYTRQTPYSVYRTNGSTEVLSAGSGRITSVSRSAEELYSVTIEFYSGYTITYSLLEEVYVDPGSLVSKCTVLGRVSYTGKLKITCTYRGKTIAFEDLKNSLTYDKAQGHDIGQYRIVYRPAEECEVMDEETGNVTWKYKPEYSVIIPRNMDYPIGSKMYWGVSEYEVADYHEDDDEVFYVYTTRNLVWSDVVFIGDSRTMSLDSGGALEYRLVPSDSVFATWGGQLIDTSALDNAQKAAAVMRKKAVFWYGINDVQMNPNRDDEAVFWGNYERVINAYKEINPKSEIYIASILTTTVHEKDYYEGQNSNIAKYNHIITEKCRENGYHYISLRSLLQGDEDYAENDNIHFSRKWYTEKFLPAMQQALNISGSDVLSDEVAEVFTGPNQASSSSNHGTTSSFRAAQNLQVTSDWTMIRDAAIMDAEFLSEFSDVVKWVIEHCEANINGVKYQYNQGARDSANCFDCSSFVYRAYREAAGYGLTGQPPNSYSANSRQEYDYLTSHNVAVITEKNLVDLVPGDLLFYYSKTGYYGTSAIGHVAMYIGSPTSDPRDGYIIHSASASGPTRHITCDTVWTGINVATDYLQFVVAYRPIPLQ